jgi:hypothetical protein
MEKFAFALHPKNWEFDGDDKVRFRALKLYDGTYLISWNDKKGIPIEMIFSGEEVIRSLANNDWMILEESIKL